MKMKRTILGLLAMALAAAATQAEEPSIAYKISGNSLAIAYTGTLFQSTDAVHWAEVASASNPYVVTFNDKKLFFCAKGETSKNMTIPLSDTVSLDMIWVEPGTFLMGSPTDELGRRDDETQHEVTLTKGYWLGKFEVTQAQYEAVMGKNPSNWKGADLPVEKVTWNEAMEFCAILTASEKAAGRLPEGYEYTLPTEAQWEYACRAETTTALNSGKDLSDQEQCSEMDEVGWYKYNCNDKTHPVGQKLPNAWGLYDMHGNVREWCLDWYEYVYPTSAVTDPTGAETGPFRVIRGGGWDVEASRCRSAYRSNGFPDGKSNIYGFRVALTPVSFVPGKNITVPLSEDVSLDMIWIKPGTFMMGSPEDELGRGNSETQHQVTLTKGYWMGKFEVTQAQYEAVMGTNPSARKGADLPVEEVSWFDAKEFCAKLTAIEREAGRLLEGYEFTLPTEAQWEYACRAGTTTALNSGKNLSDMFECPEMNEVGWYAGNSDLETHPVGQKLPNAWGLYDMHGNVNEWCLDWIDWEEDYPTSAVIDPTGPAEGEKRVIRSGSMHSYAWVCRSAKRDADNPSISYSNIGFRVALVYNPNITIPLAEDVNLDLIWIEPGTFMMGSPEGELGKDYDETQHQVTLTKGYWLGKYEVTQAQYEAIMGMNPSWNIGADLPVQWVSWFEAMAFCAKLTAAAKASGKLPEGYEFTLPTEAQWEYACRAGTTTALNSGKNLSDVYECSEMDEVGWYTGNSDNKTHPVGQKLPNAWGLYDMHGNVNEWCLDWYHGAYPTSAVTDPEGPAEGVRRVMRGGYMRCYAWICRSAKRDRYDPSSTATALGFRVALAPTKNITIPLAEDVDLDMIWIKPGTFMMGSPEDELGRYNDETQHEVTLTQEYWLGKFEVTQAQYEAVMGTNPSWNIGADRPVEWVSWNDAMAFCAKLTAAAKASGKLPEGYEFTLPTEAQWEYACRAGTTTALNSGKNLSDAEECSEMGEVGWYIGNSGYENHPVGQKLPNAWGLYDMHGNVYEWCLDWCGAYPASAVTDPTGPDTGSYRVSRGGSYYSVARNCRSALRSDNNPSDCDDNYGFRVALAPVK